MQIPAVNYAAPLNLNAAAFAHNKFGSGANPYQDQNNINFNALMMI